MKAVPLLHDPEYVKPSAFSGFEQFWLERIRDERDLVFVKLTLKIALILVPLAVLMYLPVPNYIWWAAAVLYFYFNNFAFKGPFGLMLHCTSHRPWFKAKYDYLNKVLPWALGPFFGQTPETYFSHHLGMHHVENNTREDLSTTMHYQRDNFGDFMKYFAEFFFIGLIQLVGYFHRKNLKTLRNKVLYGEFAFYILCIGLSFVSWQATLAVFVVPFVISRFIMMVGNFTQHAFLDGQDPGNNYTNSVSCVNTKYNVKCWNDGYHISHHIRPSMHYTQHPEHFRSNLEEYAEQKALVFEGIHFLHIFFYLMKKDYEKLADHLVNINGMFASREEAIALMKYRTQKWPKPKKA